MLAETTIEGTVLTVRLQAMGAQPGNRRVRDPFSLGRQTTRADIGAVSGGCSVYGIGSCPNGVLRADGIRSLNY